MPKCSPTIFPAIPYVYVFASVMFRDQLPREMMHIYLVEIYKFVKIQDLHASVVVIVVNTLCGTEYSQGFLVPTLR